MSLQRAVWNAPPQLVRSFALTPPQLEQSICFARPQLLTSPPQHQIGRETLRHENPLEAHEEELVAVEVARMVEEVVVVVVVEYDG